MAVADGMKAVVLCAGEGTRLRPLTFSKPKHLLRGAGKPLLGHVLECLAQAGVRRIADSIVQHDCRIVQVALERSVLGEGVQISGREPLGNPLHNPLHMILGDMAQIRMF